MDVARLAGVSPITASRALNTPEKVSAAALARVREAVKRSGYVPNLLAGGLASSRSRLIAAIVPTIAGWVFLDMVQSLTDALNAAGYQVMLGQSGYDGLREDGLIDAFLGRRPDGIVITGVTHSAHARRRLAAAGIPVVETWDLAPRPVDMLVGFSHERVGAAVAKHLHERGYRNPAVVTADDARARRRADAFVAAARKLSGMSPAVVVEVTAPTNLKQGRDALGRLLHGRRKVDCAFCSSDLLALGLLTEAHALRLDIPGRLGVIGFGDLPYAAHLHPPLTTVRVDGARIGLEAARRILARAGGESVEHPVLDVGFSIVTRGTT